MRRMKYYWLVTYEWNTPCPYKRGNGSKHVNTSVKYIDGDMLDIIRDSIKEYIAKEEKVAVTEVNIVFHNICKLF